MASVSLNLIYGAVLGAAVLHALWNALIKSSSDKLLSAIGIAGAAALLAALCLPWVTPPALASWPFLAASLGLQVVYMRLVAHIYRDSDMSVSYPVMRGTAPLLVAIVSAVFFHNVLSAAAVAGIATICIGILCIGWPRKTTGQPARLHLALMNGAVIATYTLVDGTGVRLAQSPAGYTLWIFLLQGSALVALALPGGGRRLVKHLCAHWKAAFIGGAETIISYGIALWAMTLAPIAIIAALRETSILFGVLISGLFLHERLTAARILGACILVAGVIVLRLAP